MTAEARRVAFEALRDVADKDKYTNLALQQAFAKERLDARDRALCTEIVYGTVQRQRSLDALLQPLMSRNVEDLDVNVRTLLRMTAYQLGFLDKIPAYAAINDAVELTKRVSKKASGFVNGVLRSFVRDSRPVSVRLSCIAKQTGNFAEEIGILYSYPTWLVQSWEKSFGREKTLSLVQACNQPSSFAARVNRLKATRDDVLADLHNHYGDVARASTLSGDGIRFERGIDTHAWGALKQGQVSIQDEGAMLIAPLLDLQPTAKVLDMCAGLGTKTTHIAELQGDQGLVTACDIHPHKLQSLRDAALRLGMESISVVLADARSLAVRPDHQETYDAVLLDAPCTGLGVLRRRPDIRWKRTPADVASLSKLQRELLEVAVQLVKPGGVVVYCTCTLLDEENRDVVQSVVDESRFRVEWDNLSQDLPLMLQTSVDDVGGCLLTPDTFGTDGFYMARLRKRDL